MKPNPLRRLKLAFAGTLAVFVLLAVASFVTGSQLLIAAMPVAAIAGSGVMAACVPSRAKAAAAADRIAAGSADRPAGPTRRERSGFSLVEIMLGMMVVSILAIGVLSFVQLGAG